MGQNSGGAEKRSQGISSCSMRTGSHSCLHETAGGLIIAAVLPTQVIQVPNPLGKDRIVFVSL